MLLLSCCTFSLTAFDPTWPKCRKVQDICLIFCDFIGFISSFFKMRSCLWILGLGFWTYGWICLLGPSGPNLVSGPQAPRSRHFLRFYNFIGFISSFLKNQGPVCEYWRLSSGLMVGYFLGQSGPNLTSRLQAPRSRHFSRFYNFIGLISSFLKKWGPVCEYWSQGFGLMAGYVFWAQVAPRFSF